jgi:3-dehydroquinate synthetase
LTQLRAQQGTALSVPGLLAGLRHDKKGAAGDPRFVLLERAGTWKLDVPLPRPLLERLLADSGARAIP